MCSLLELFSLSFFPVKNLVIHLLFFPISVTQTCSFPNESEKENYDIKTATQQYLSASIGIYYASYLYIQADQYLTVLLVALINLCNYICICKTGLMMILIVQMRRREEVAVYMGELDGHLIEY